MTTARTIIKKALNKIGALVKNEDPSSDEANDALVSLNALIASWSNDSLNIYGRTWESFTLTGGTGSYTIGTSQTFNTARPMAVLEAYIRSGTIDYPVKIITDEAYNLIAFKSLTGIPEALNFNNAYPSATIRLYPVPSSSYSLFILSEKEVTEFTTLDTVMSLPNGWERALTYNLALELAPEYHQEPDASIVKIAMDSMGMIKLGVAKVRTMDAPVMGLRTGYRGNIYSGEV